MRLQVLPQKALKLFSKASGPNKGHKDFEGGGKSADTAGYKDVGEHRFSESVKQDLSSALRSGDRDKIHDTLNNAGWKVDKKVIDKIPEHLVKTEGKLADSFKSQTNPRGGIKFETKSDNIRIMENKPGGQPAQQQDYVKIVSGGKVIGRDGNVISQKDFPNPASCYTS
ncbi:hypothetical protein [Candidatus Lariskella endosymbiont of Hedychridium roseum]|uniref:hypothetical protein n=1 Tax=Candidatus Lariskella endosymbiont of Hedychridium roseum TaxID=3077949 RepID=UPI0030D5D3F1